MEMNGRYSICSVIKIYIYIYIWIVFTITFNLNFDSIRKVKITTISILHRRKMLKTDSARFQCLNIAGQFEISPSVSQ